MTAVQAQHFVEANLPQMSEKRIAVRFLLSLLVGFNVTSLSGMNLR
jgi:hypothetical protein